MKKFNFTLNSVLEYRKTLEELAMAALIQSREKLREAELSLELLKQEIDAVSNPEKARLSASGAYFLQRERYMKLLKEKRHKLEFSVKQLKAEVDLNLAKLQETIKEVKKLEKLSENEHSAWNAEFLREEQKINDEIANVRTCFPVNGKVSV